MHNIKDIRCNSRLHNLVLAGVWPPDSRRRRVHARAILTASYVDHGKRVACVSISVLACGYFP